MSLPQQFILKPFGQVLVIIKTLPDNENMSTRGAKVERSSVSEQPHELKYEAKKTGTSADKVATAKRSTGSNQRETVEKKLKK
ncbi:hypothetical protein ACVW2L_001013 [Mucilaginibacter sp. HD30]